LRVVSQACVPIATKVGRQPEFDIWYLVPLDNKKPAYSFTGQTRELNTKQSKDVEAWGVAQNDPTIEKLQNYINRFPEGFFAKDAKKQLRELDINLKIEELDSAYELLDTKFNVFKDELWDEKLNKNIKKHFDGNLPRKLSRLKKNTSLAIDDWKKIKSAKNKLRAGPKTRDYRKFLKQFEQVKKSLGRFTKRVENFRKTYDDIDKAVGNPPQPKGSAGEKSLSLVEQQSNSSSHAEGGQPETSGQQLKNNEDTAAQGTAASSEDAPEATKPLDARGDPKPPG